MEKPTGRFGQKILLVVSFIYLISCLVSSGVLYAGQLGVLSIGKGVVEELAEVSAAPFIGIHIFTAFVSVMVGSVFAIFITIAICAFVALFAYLVVGNETS